MRRSGPLRRRGRPRNIATSRVDLVEARRELVASLLVRRPWCEFTVCGRPSVDAHEIKSRARGGSILDATNIAMLCREHHDWVTTHPALAQSMGLLRHSWDPPLVDPQG